MEHHIQNIIIQKVEVKDYNVKIDGRNLFDQPKIMILKHMKTLQRLILVKQMITQLVRFKI